MIRYGNPLAAPGQRQPSGSINIDAYGLVQAQLTFAFDSAVDNTTDMIDEYSMGLAYPDDLGFEMKSYKYHITSAKGDVAMMTVDYMGIARGVGYTDAQVTGVSNTMAQPIETHPNFTKHQTSWAGGVLGGTPTAPLNRAIFVPSTSVPGQFTFGGFGISTDPATPNIKAGVRQYLRPMVNTRGTIFFDFANASRAAALVNANGWRLSSSDDLGKLLGGITTASTPGKWLFTSVNVEPIGTPSSNPYYKVTYDLMYANDVLGWDADIYPQLTAAIF